MNTTPRNGQFLLNAGQANQEVYHNLAQVGWDALIGAKVDSVAGATAPPGGPVDGTSTITGTGCTGAFAGHDSAFAHYYGGGWYFVPLYTGLVVWDTAASSLKVYNGATWSAVSTGGGLNTQVSKTVNYTALNTDYEILCDASGGSFTITLPAAAGLTGKRYWFKKTTAGNTVTVDGNASETIDGTTTKVLRDTGETLEITSDGTNWRRVTNYAGDVPIGAVIPWHKTFTNTPSIPSGYVECNGATLSDTSSVYNGQTIPNINGSNQFLKGASTSGTTTAAATHTHTVGTTGVQSGAGVSPNFGTTNATQAPDPANITMVMIMRVK